MISDFLFFKMSVGGIPPSEVSVGGIPPSEMLGNIGTGTIPPFKMATGTLSTFETSALAAGI